MHHAYLIIASSGSLESIPKEDRVVSPDVTHISLEKFGIDEARKLKYESSLTPVARPYRVFIVVIDSITLEAQNALLKLFEDPQPAVRFYIVAAREDMLIPTLRSRLMLLATEEREGGMTEEARTFLNVAYRERLALVAEKMKENDGAWMERLMNGIEAWALENDPLYIKEVIFIRGYEKARSASKKMLLEHMALSLPVLG